MGNSGSTHNLNVERSHSELDSYLQTHSQQLRRPLHRQHQLGSHDAGDAFNPQRMYKAEWRRSYPTPLGQKNSTPELPELNAQFRVLPTLDERLHLRATTNGAILNSGGTISGRKQTESQLVGHMPSHLKVPPMQRSRTFVFDTEKEPNPTVDRKKSAQAEFTRSQTLLHVKLKANKQELSSGQNASNLKQMQRHTYSEPDFVTSMKNDAKSDSSNLLDTLARPSRQNKYNKKRRAPEAPTELTFKTAATPAAKQESTNVKTSSQQPPPTGQIKQQLFAKNTDKVSKNSYAAKSSEKVPALPQNASFERAKAVRSSVSGNQVLSQLNEPTKPAYRREKSSDAILLTTRRAPEPAAFAKASHLHQRPTKAEQPVAAPDNLLTKPAVLQSSKIPQLKRTFYFGMDLPNATTNNAQTPKAQAANDNSQRKFLADGANVNAEKRLSVVAKEHQLETGLLTASSTTSYKMVYDNSVGLEEKIDDSGLRVCIRPTLPRRQVDTPSFSPALAWRALSDEQERLLRAPINTFRSVQQELKGTYKINELPIQANRQPHIRQLPKASHIKTWTPEQDLADENDDRDETLAAEDDSSSDEYRSKCDGDGFLFYGSKAKKPNQDASSAPSPVHVFSLSLPRDAHIQHEMESLKPDNVYIYKSLQKSKRGNCFNRYLNQSSAERQSNKQISITQIDGSNNWLLHKSASNSTLHPDGLDSSDDRKPLPSIEPQSLKLLTGGKHVMYLPGNYVKPTVSLKAAQTEAPVEEAQPKMGNNRHFKNRQRHVPESLQDKTPIFPVTSHDYTKSAKLDDDKPFYQRFSLQNPVRMFEKRLLTEKSAKCTETNAEHKIDLEALKRVEEDFQRKRAYEKENIRYQMRLHFGNDGEQHERYQSLPITPRLDSNYLKIDINDTNNNLFCRDDPEGCVASVSCVSPEAAVSKLRYGATNMLD